jgi:ribosomal peptide maturation radical SAM protein 1
MALEVHTEPVMSRPPVGTAVALVNMPFGLADRPSISCGLLKGGLTRAGYDATVHYLNLELAAELGPRFYSEMSVMRVNSLLGDWLFSVAAFGYRPDEAAYRELCAKDLDPATDKLGADFDRLCELRNEVLPRWIERWADAVDWGSCLAVGFTSSFEQNTASLALARAIKERHPNAVTIFGGANFDGPMGREYARVFPFIDYAVIGEGDLALLQILKQLTRGESAQGIPGVVAHRQPPGLDTGPAAPVKNLDDLPDPDYEEYFATLFRLGRDRTLDGSVPRIPFETSRGCWWGEKQHCTFCGLNDHTIKFRSKSAERALEQLERMASRYKIVNFEATDNILDYGYLEKFCGPLAENHFDYRFFYEVKANLSPAQIRAMARAGVNSIQPGIESMSSNILALMRKGITMLRNVRFLKWARYYGMQVSWNVLTGFPGETEEDYVQQLAVIRRLRHLPPPSGQTRISLERFSPFFYDPSFPVSNARPVDVYRLIYPDPDLDLGEIAYFFHHDMGRTLPDDFHQELRDEIADWHAAWKRRPLPTLAYQRAPGWIQIVDRRNGEPVAHAFQDEVAAIYELCGETDRTVAALGKHLGEKYGTEAASGEIQATLDEFCRRGLMVEEKGRYLSLAHPVNRHW